MPEREFRVFAWRPFGNQQRLRQCKQTEERTHVYVKGHGPDENSAAADALVRGKRYLSRYGWDKFLCVRTIADQHRLERPAELKPGGEDDARD